MAKPGIEGFERLNDNVSVYRPAKPNTRRSPSDKSPAIIVYCSWMGASEKHIAKYTTGYQQLFPRATIVLVQQSVRDVFISADLSAANDIITAYLVENGSSSSRTAAGGSSSEDYDGVAPERNGIVLCMASNGGAMSGMRISNRLQHIHERAPFDAVVLDCSPSLPRLPEGARAIAAGFAPAGPGGVFYALVYWLCYVLLGLWAWVDRVVLGHDDLLLTMRADLISTSLFPRVTPRLYLYSKADVMVRWEDVHAHAEAARARKYVDVREEVFEKAPHVALLTEDSKRYWAAVRKVLVDE